MRKTKTGKQMCYRAVAFSVLLVTALSGCGVPAADSGRSVYIHQPEEVSASGEAVSSSFTINENSFAMIDRVVASDVDYGFPGAQLAVMHRGEMIYENAWGYVNAYEPDGSPKEDRKEITTDTLFDLASVTKMFSVVYAFQKLMTDGAVQPDTPLVDILGPEFATTTMMYSWLEVDEETMRAWKERITVRDLLCHEAGMPADPRSYSQYMECAMAPHTKEEIRASLFRVPLRCEPGTETLYSDLDYMLAGIAVEALTGMPLDEYLRDTFFTPLHLAHITYNPLRNGFSEADVAATELNGNTRDGNVYHTAIRTATLQGEVHDENAFHAMDGVSGHAGLFSNAHDLAILASLMLTGEYNGTRYFSDEIRTLFTEAKNAKEPEWGIGWWRSDGGNRPGFFSAHAPAGVIGHNGWTGTNVWIDPENELVIVYLTNRINSPVTNPAETLERFDGSWYTAGASAFVPGILYTVGMAAPARAQDTVMSRLEETMWNSFALLPEDADKEGTHPSVKNANSKRTLYHRYAEESGEARYRKKAEEADRVWETFVPGENPADRFRPEEEARNGDARFELYLPLLENKRVALFTNATGMVYDNGTGDTQHILDALLARGVKVTSVFAPEHGVRGEADAGAEIGDETDPETGVPVYSLYYNGRTQMPSAEQMETFDLLVVDIQDVGVRFYTYYLTMLDLMDACAVHGKELIVLDRVNPNGFYVDGPVLQSAFSSGVGRLPIPLVHGMTLGELAQMINGEGWLSAGKESLNLTVIPCENYTHQMTPSIMTRPSPNLKDMRAVYLYPSIALFENSVVSVGRGTTEPFVVFGAPALAGVDGYGETFVPASVSGAENPKYQNETCYGMRLRGLPETSLRAGKIELSYLIDAYQAIRKAHPEIAFFGTPDGNGYYWIDYLCGTDRVRLLIEEGKSAQEVRSDWMEDVALFKKQRAPYLLYPE